MARRLRSFFYIFLSLFFLILSVLFFQLGMSWRESRDEREMEIVKVQKDIQVARTLDDGRPVDTYSDLLIKLSGYCDEVKIPSRSCNVTSRNPEDEGDYTSRMYSVVLEPILMDKTLEYFRKLEGLPDNVRVGNSQLERVAPRGRRNESVEPYLRLKIQMKEIKFKQS